MALTTARMLQYILKLGISPSKDRLSAVHSPPAIKKLIHNHGMVKHDIVYMSVGLERHNTSEGGAKVAVVTRYLSTEGDSTRLAFGADACWPWRVVQTVFTILHRTSSGSRTCLDQLHWLACAGGSGRRDV